METRDGAGAMLTSGELHGSPTARLWNSTRIQADFSVSPAALPQAAPQWVFLVPLTCQPHSVIPSEFLRHWSGCTYKVLISALGVGILQMCSFLGYSASALGAGPKQVLLSVVPVFLEVYFTPELLVLCY